MASLKNTTINDTGYIQVASGTTAQRTSPANGMTRYNSDLRCTEIYNSATSTWNCLCDSTYNVELLLVGGGGSGGAATNSSGGGGGGGGGVVYVSSYTITGGTSYSITVGAGSPGVAIYQYGTGTRNLSPYGSMLSRGGDTTGFGYTAYGGGNGCGNGAASATQGGSGGGAKRDCASGCNAASITTGQGNSGGNAGGTSCASAGGGGGAGGAGNNGCGDCTGCPATSGCSRGGDGLLYNWLGDNMYYGGGGGGSFEVNSNIYDPGNCVPPQGGKSGGGSGSMAVNSQDSWNGTVSSAGSGLPGTGGGGGGGNGGSCAGAGGSGIVMIRYSGAPIGIGGDVVQYSGYTVHVYRGSGTFLG